MFEHMLLSELPISPETAAEQYVWARLRDHPEQTSVLNQLFELEVLRYYDWLDLATLYADWENRLRIFKHGTTQSRFPPTCPFVSLVEILERYKQHEDPYIPLHFLIIPSHRADNSDISTDRASFDDRAFRFRTAAELHHADGSLPDTNRVLDQWWRIVAWIREQFEYSLKEEYLPEKEGILPLGSDILGFARSVLALRQAMQHGAEGDSLRGVFANMESCIREIRASPAEKYRLLLSFAVSAMRLRLAESEGKIDPHKPEDLLTELGGYFEGYPELFLQGKVTMFEEAGFPVFSVEEPKLHTLLRMSDRYDFLDYRDDWKTIATSLAGRRWSSHFLRLNHLKKLDFLYRELCDGFSWDNRESPEIIVSLADGNNIDRIRGLLVEGWYCQDSEVAEKTAYLEALLSSGLDTETLAPLLCIAEESKWQDLGRNADSWARIFSHLKQHPDCRDIREIYRTKTAEVVATGHVG